MKSTFQKLFLSLNFLLLVAASCLTPTTAVAGDAPRVSRNILATTEKSIDERIMRLWNDNPLVLLGSTRGIYLDGYGAVLSAEVNLVNGPPVAFVQPVPNAKQVAEHKAKKLQRLPELKNMLRQAMMDTAASLDPIPAEEQIVLVMFLSRYPWEDTGGLPVQVMMRAQKKQLLEIQRSTGAAKEAALQTAIQVTEF